MIRKESGKLGLNRGLITSYTYFRTMIGDMMISLREHLAIIVFYFSQLIARKMRDRPFNYWFYLI